MSGNVSKRVWTQAALFMDTLVSLRVVSSRSEAEVQDKMTQAFEAFRTVEKVCSRFHEQSEVRRLSIHIGTPLPVSDVLFETVRFAWNVADLTDGAFDPTIGHTLEQYGFNRHYLTGEVVGSHFVSQEAVSYRDVMLDEEKRTVCLCKPLVLDLGAVAKGFAVDWAVQHLRELEGFVVDAGGDLFAGGLNEKEEPWHIGIRHPVHQEENIGTLRLTDAAICTSGSYERVSPVQADTHHLIDPRSGVSQVNMLSCSVIAPFAMMADAFSTAAFILGPEKGKSLLSVVGVEGLWVSSSLEIDLTSEMKRYWV